MDFDDLPDTVAIHAAQILVNAARLITGDRNRQHGDVRENHGNIARLRGAYLNRPLADHESAMLDAMMKLARTQAGAFNLDDYTDAAAYIAIAGALRDGRPLDR